MKVFRVVTHRDGETVKAPGKVTTATEQIDRRYAAETIEQVWNEIEDLRNSDDETLVAIIEEHSQVTVLPA